MTAPDIDPAIVDYLVRRDGYRAERANTAWRTFTPYERRLVREAAVMGYVLGRRAGQLDGRNGVSILDDPPDFPTDAAIVTTVVQHCDSTADLYPYIAAAASGRRRRVTRKRLWPSETR